MDSNKPTTKVPYSITKQQLYKMCYPAPENKVKRRINEIIFDNRSKNYPDCKGKTRIEIIRTVYVDKKELKEYFETYGLPDGLEF